MGRSEAVGAAPRQRAIPAALLSLPVPGGPRRHLRLGVFAGLGPGAGEAAAPRERRELRGQEGGRGRGDRAARGRLPRSEPPLRVVLGRPPLCARFGAPGWNAVGAEPGAGGGRGRMGSAPLGAAVPGDPSPFSAVLTPRRGSEKRGRAENKSSARDTITQPILIPTRKFMSGTRVGEAAGCDPPAAAAAARAQHSPGAAVGSGCGPSPAARSGPRPGAAAAPRAAAHGARRGEPCAALERPDGLKAGRGAALVSLLFRS